MSTPRNLWVSDPSWARKVDPQRSFGERRGEAFSRVGVTKPAPAKRTKRSRR
ncbi:MAG: hypothetical protein QOD63_846 [Actinomycetota bacterium]|nr:hypothetical protein [Actinomycetota bacterium]